MSLRGALLTLIGIVVTSISHAEFRNFQWGTFAQHVEAKEGKPTPPIGQHQPEIPRQLMYLNKRLSDEYVAFVQFLFDESGRLEKGEYSNIERSQVEETDTHSDYLYFSKRLRQKYGAPDFETEIVANPLGYALPQSYAARNGYVQLREVWETDDTVILHQLAVVEPIGNGHEISWFSEPAFQAYLCFQKTLHALAEEEDVRLVDGCSDSEQDRQIDEAL